MNSRHRAPSATSGDLFDAPKGRIGTGIAPFGDGHESTQVERPAGLMDVSLDLRQRIVRQRHQRSIAVRVLSSVATIVDGVLYLSSADQHVYAVDLATGRQRWAYATTGIPTTPVVVDGRVIVGTDLGKLIALMGSGATPTPQVFLRPDGAIQAARAR